MKKKSILGLALLALFLFGGLGTAQAITDVTPANSALNPVNEDLYVVNQANTKIDVYNRQIQGSWSAAGISIALPAGSKCYGLAVSPDGNKLYISINAGASSIVRVHDFTSASDTDLTGASWSSFSSPAGIALGGGNKLYLADKGIGRVRVFNTDTNAWERDITDHLAGKSNLYGVAVTAGDDNYKVYVSQKSSPGSIFVFNYSGGTITYANTINTGLTYPTYLKIVGDKLYVAVNGTDGVDIKVYSTTDDSWVGDVKSGIMGSYGWTAFDVSKDGAMLYIKKSANSSETINKLYQIKTADIPGTAAQIAADTGMVKSDGLAVSFDKSKVALSNSPDGNVQFVDLAKNNNWPPMPENLQQFTSNGTPIEKFGVTTENQIRVKFTVSDPDGDDLTPIVLYKKMSDGSYTRVVGPVTPSGGGVDMPVPNLESGDYEWGAAVQDSFGAESPMNDFAGDIGSTDFTVNYIPPDRQGPETTITNPTNGATVSGNVDLQASINDTATGNSNISAAEYFIDSAGTSGSGVAMNATDGSFSSPIENVNASWDSRTVPNGEHTIYVHGKDAADNWGALKFVGIIVNNAPGDTTAPAAITTLSAAVGDNSGDIKISWEAVGDDGMIGTATSYIVKYSYTGPINTDADFNAATTYVQNWMPKASGQTENYVMSGRTPGNKIWVSIKAQDEVPNIGALGNWAVTIVKNFVPAPIIDKIYPNRGPNDRVNHIVIEGQNLFNNMIAKIGNTDLLNVHQDSDTMVQADVPPAITPGVYEISITCPGGTYDDAAHANPNNDFTVFDPNVNPDTVSPEVVTNFNARDGEDGQSTLTWTNPASGDLREVIVLRKEGSYPTNHSDAAAVKAFGTLIPEPGAAVSYVDKNLTNTITYYYTVFSRDTSDNWNETVDSTSPNVNADTGTPGGGVTGQKTFTITYLSETQSDNWISIPFNNAKVNGQSIVTLGNLLNSLGTAFTPQDGDLLTLSWYNNTNQTPVSIQRDYSSGQWNSWDPTTELQNVTTGQMLILSISNPNGRTTFSSPWTISGDIPAEGSVKFAISYLSETQAENWISAPNKANMATLGALLDSTGTSFTPATGDLVTLSWYDNVNQTPMSIQRDYDGTRWNSWDPTTETKPVSLGDPFKYSISNASGRTTFTTQWP